MNVLLAVSLTALVSLTRAYGQAVGEVVKGIDLQSVATNTSSGPGLTKLSGSLQRRAAGDVVKTVPLRATARLTGGKFNVEAIFNFEFREGEGTFIEGRVLRGLNDSTEYRYHIHTNPISADGNCASALGHLDPVSVTDYIACDPSQPWYCQEGDLSGKHGKLQGTVNGNTPAFSFIDPYVRFYPQPFSILGRSVVIHAPDLTRVTCGNITSNIDGTDLGKPSDYVTDYPKKAPPKQQSVTPFTNGMTATNIAQLATLPFSLPEVFSQTNVILTETLVATDIAGKTMVTIRPIAEPITTDFHVTVGATLPTQANPTFPDPTAGTPTAQSPAQPQPQPTPTSPNVGTPSPVMPMNASPPYAANAPVPTPTPQPKANDATPREAGKPNLQLATSDALRLSVSSMAFVAFFACI
ncbi:uncharacterized protein L969DRAFT_47043 [Mixia osmundae IAM 14324]|uniref:Superoxide dismutase copper/zinc binding domain-containing protein n=1 Tax=Mixia osmundae (strain CBS 9802 / IAM 14324 / JCM 22182 / KY 12970) TaxID=764103 RepID=G7DSA9_MIXOS|nr:uncharacterized protein L969DRAFT_47043 [Mixia osmundae IAM 14324]KEI40921.1 hypothetical protein L969DRAFT_47043 [Mixia osmundae IAM 14324]GAA93469.1 hypothetical protein E5Q_00110 [Mixia osmundae IAM 14324]